MITVLINNRNLVIWPKEMVACIQKFEGVSEIIVLDNDSTYQPTLDWYETLEEPVGVMLLNWNVGHTAPFIPWMLSQVETPYLVVTDPDLGLLDVPTDVLLKMKGILEETGLPKIGLSLRYETVPMGSPYFEHVNSWEKYLREGRPIIHPGVRNAPVDTTFAMMRTEGARYFVGGARMEPPYCARHYPWELIDITEEYQYYLDRANESCSYKKFLRK